jgi:hypothetical protein
VPTGRRDVLTGRISLYPLEEATYISSTEEAVCIHWMKRWHHQKKISVPTGRCDDLTDGEKNLALAEQVH